MSLTTLISSDVVCAWCGKKTGKTFINSGIEKHQEHLKKFGHLTSHGICHECQDELLNEDNIKRREEKMDSRLRGNNEIGRVAYI